MTVAIIVGIRGLEFFWLVGWFYEKEFLRIFFKFIVSFNTVCAINLGVMNVWD